MKTMEDKIYFPTFFSFINTGDEFASTKQFKLLVLNLRRLVATKLYTLQLVN
jgi:hypothetical protein